MFRFYLGACALVLAAPAIAKPIAFADGTTVMAEYGAGTMQELQIFYAPRFDYSVGGGHVDFTSDEDGQTEHITYARLNWLAHRWNLESAGQCVRVGWCRIRDWRLFQRIESHWERRRADRLRNAACLCVPKNRFAAKFGILDSRRHLAIGIGSLQTRLWRNRDLVRLPGASLHRQSSFRDRDRGAVAPLQGRCVDRGRCHQRRETTSHGHVQLLNRKI